MAVSQFLGGFVTPVVSLAVAAIFLYVVADTWTSYGRLRQFKGPWLAAFSQYWLLRETFNGRLYLSLAAAFDKYASSVIRIGPDTLLTDDPVIIRHINAPRSPWSRGFWYDGMKLDPNGMDNVLSARDEKLHADLRSKIIIGYSGKEVPTLEADIDARVIELLDLIKRDFTGKVLDFALLAQFFSLDAMTKIAFGEPFGFLTKNEDVYDYNRTTRAFFPFMELADNIPIIHSFLSSRIVQALAAPKPEDRIGMGAVIGVSQRVVAERFGPDAKLKDDMLGSFVSHGLTQREAEAETLLTILAGADSTATTIRVTFLYILTNPSVYVKLLAEIDEAVEKGNVSFPVIKNSESKELPYLQACILEGLRIFPPLNGITDKIAPPKGETVNGIFFPGGTRVGFGLYHMMRRTDIWGQDAAFFRPERWIEADAETRHRWDRVWELGFSSGRSTCLGKGIALMELNKVFVELLRRYDWSIVNPINPMKTICYAIHVQTDFHLRAWPRQRVAK